MPAWRSATRASSRCGSVTSRSPRSGGAVSGPRGCHRGGEGRIRASALPRERWRLLRARIIHHDVERERAARRRLRRTPGSGARARTRRTSRVEPDVRRDARDARWRRGVVICRARVAAMQKRKLGAISRSARSASAAWGCASSTAAATTPSRSRRSTARSTSASRCSTRPTCTGRSRTSSSSAARSRTGATRSCSRPSSASCADRTATRIGINGRPEYVRAGVRREPAAARRRPHRSLLPAPRRPDDADRGHRRRDGRAGARRQGPLPRTVRGGARDDPPRVQGRIRSPRCRPSTRCGRAIPRTACSPTCRELGIGFVAYSPLGRGFLTGQIKTFDDLAPDDFRRHIPRFQGENFAKNLELVEHLTRARARRRACTPAQLALAWVLARGDDIVPIPGTKRRRYLEENAEARADRALGRRARADRRDRTAGRRRRRALSRAGDGERQPLARRQRRNARGRSSCLPRASPCPTRCATTSRCRTRCTA